MHKRIGIDFVQIGVEVLVTVEADSAQCAVVKRLFHDVGEFAAPGVFQHPPGEEDQRHGRTAFRIGGVVRQIPVDGELLLNGGGTAPAGDVHPFLSDAVEHPLADGEQLLVLRGGGDVGHAGVEIEGADTVPHRILLLPDRPGRLPVGKLFAAQQGAVPFRLFLKIVRRRAAAVDEEFGKFGIFFLAGGVGKLTEGEFQLLVTGISLLLTGSGAEYRADVVGITGEGVDKLPVPGGVKMGNRGFHQVAGAVKFVAFKQMLPAVFRFDAGVVGVEVAIRLLSGDDQVDETVELFRQSLVLRVKFDHVGHPLEHLGEVGVEKTVRLIRHARLPVEPETVDAAGFPTPRHRRGNGGVAAAFHARRKHRVAHDCGK